MPTLLLHLTDGAVRVPLRAEGLVFGREPGGCDVALGSPLVSGKHATLLQEGGRWLLRDLASLNGTFIGSERVHGERVLVAPCTLFFADVRAELLEDRQEPPPPPPPPPPTDLLVRLRLGARILRDAADSGVGAAQRVRAATDSLERVLRAADATAAQRAVVAVLEDGGSLSGTAEELELVFEAFTRALDRFEVLLAEAEPPRRRG